MNFSILKRFEAILRRRFFSLLEAPTRLLVPLFIVVCVKAIGSFLLYHRLKLASWEYLFFGWDSAWYLSIADKGYLFSDQSFAFFPGLPLFSQVLNLFLHDSLLALTAFSTLVGTLWIPVYQLVAEIYMNRFQALKSTLFYAFFPAVFLFTTVIYSEGLFLFSTLTAWYFFKKEKHLLSMIFASIATISRPPGILILLPILIETLQKHSHGSALRRRNILYYAIPLFSFFSWLLYCRITINDWFASFNRHGWDDLLSLRLFLLNMFSNEAPQFLQYNTQVWIFLILAPILIHALRRMDRSLALYSAIYYAGILVVGALVSIPRFISFLFPIWLPLTLKLSQVKKSNLLTVILCTTFCYMGLSLWNSFLNGEFIF